MVNIRENLRMKHVWQIPFLLDYFDEDNDSAEEDSEEDDGGKKPMVLRQGHGLEYFIRKEKELLTKIKEKKTAKLTKKAPETIALSNKKLVKTLKEFDWD